MTSMRTGSRFTQRNQAVERALQALEILSAGESALSLQEISHRLQMHPSTAHRVLKPLEEQGYITRWSETDLYRLGPKVLMLATRMLNIISVREVAAPYLRRLSYAIGESVCLARYHEGEVTYQDCAEGLSSCIVVLRTGGRMPAHWVPAGRVQLAFLGEDEAERLLQRGLAPSDQGREMTADDLKQNLAGIRDRGYESDDGDWMPGLSSVAAPVLDANGAATAAITVVGFSERMTPPRLDDIIQRVCDAAREISTHMGFRMPRL